MRLIDADRLIRYAIAFFTGDYANISEFAHFSHIVNIAPTVDAVPVVRCRDCIAFEEIGKHPTNNGGTPFGYCYHWQYEQGMSPNEVDGNAFCSYGERRKSNENHT